MRVKSPKCSGLGRAITRPNMIKPSIELKDFCIPATIPLSCSGTVSWKSCVIARSDIHKPRRDVTIPAKSRAIETYENALLNVGASVAFEQLWVGVTVGKMVEVDDVLEAFMKTANEDLTRDDVGVTVEFTYTV